MTLHTQDSNLNNICIGDYVVFGFVTDDELCLCIDIDTDNGTLSFETTKTAIDAIPLDSNLNYLCSCNGLHGNWYQRLRDCCAVMDDQVRNTSKQNLEAKKEADSILKQAKVLEDALNLLEVLVQGKINGEDPTSSELFELEDYFNGNCDKITPESRKTRPCVVVCCAVCCCVLKV